MKILEKFNQEKAEERVNSLIKQYKIKVIARSKGSSGYAHFDKNEMKIPYPTNVDRFAVCLHEIHHIIAGETQNGKKLKRYEQEFYADMYARNILEEFNYNTTEWDRRTQWQILSRVAMATNRGCKEVNQEVANYFYYIDFSKWFGKKVFVGADKTFVNQTIEIDGDKKPLPFNPRNTVLTFHHKELSEDEIEKLKDKVGNVVDDFKWTDERVLEFSKTCTQGSYGDYDGCKTIKSKLIRFKEIN
jgi:hypothetical protein